MIRRFAACALPTLALAIAALPGCAAAQSGPASGITADDDAKQVLADLRARVPSQEVIYFVLPDRFEDGDPSNDRGGLSGGRLKTGYDPTSKGFFHGGDLKGLTEKLPYLQDMGITAIWFAPIFQNKVVQGNPGDESAGYHGYWVTDFTRPDSHFGTKADFKAFVDAAHARGMKVYMDIITNHTADVIRYRDGDANDYKYRSRGDFPYSREGGLDGKPINPGFMGDTISTPENFAHLTNPDWAYKPYVPADEKNIKVPAWLNNPIYYHNRGNSTFTGEDSRFGDFSGLDDLFTENPFVRQGMIDIYSKWIDDYGIDGFRIDTARHVDPGFWQVFVPAIMADAHKHGIPNFTMFGEVYKDVPDNGYIAQYTRRDKLPAVLDFAFQAAMRDILGRNQGTVVLAHMFDGDVLYQGGEKAALNLPTFLGNHDMGRFSTLIKHDMPDISQDELLKRVMLGHAMLLTLRGAPVIYYGDEQGFVGGGGDQLAREDMFPSKTAVYNSENLIGTDATTANANFDESHPLYRLIAQLSALRRAHPALTLGLQKVRHYEQTPGVFAASRFDPETGNEIVLAFNTTGKPRSANVVVGYDARTFNTLSGTCPAKVSAPGSAKFDLPAFGWAVCQVSETTE
ncbi:alpha-amylase family glycosyl hydrolase [Tsuneonella mangrovi]|uniref:alpha-amylase family glycosyl hydrolase n=1 Tax=Tsuneonella mangrovi TaxID=1982042 RepID=UPI000BA20B09|nr:alpha-amylase family glycosyl hydrolase [Tsuneonella mangrovi]